MSRNIHLLIKNEYDRRQKAAQDDLSLRKSDVYLKVSRIEEIDSEIQRVGIKCNKLILLGSAPFEGIVGQLRSEIESLKQEKLKLLSENGYPSNYFEAVYDCPACNDTGFVSIEGASEKCSCYKQQYINLLYGESNLKLVETENFDSFDENYFSSKSDKVKYGFDMSPRENILLIKERCHKFIENFDSPEEKNLFFSGPTGVGKTFMTNCIAREILNSGRTVLYQTAPVLFNTISEYKMRFSKDDEFEDAGYKNLFDVELLIIDDLGTEPQSASRYAELLTILNTRHANNLNSPCKIIISTNFGVKKLEEYYTERVISRIMGGFDRLMFIGDDIRRTKG